MIRFALTCARDHGFDSWFPNAAAFDRQAASGYVTCPVCGSAEVSKALMAPAVLAERAPPGLPDGTPTGPARNDQGHAGRPPAHPAPAQPPQAHPAQALPLPDRMAEALADLRREVERNAEYVGPDFAAEARAIHDGEAPGRAIWGEARAEEARALVEDGIRIAPLPFAPRRKMN